MAAGNFDQFQHQIDSADKDDLADTEWIGSADKDWRQLADNDWPDSVDTDSIDSVDKAPKREEDDDDWLGIRLEETDLADYKDILWCTPADLQG